MSQVIRHFRTTLPNIQNLCMKYTAIGPCDQFKTQVINRLVDQVFTLHKPDSSLAFKQVLDTERAKMDETLIHLIKQLTEILDIYFRLKKQLKKPPLHWLDAMADIQDQLNHLLHANFIISTPQDNFNDLPRYLKAIEKRLEKIQANPERDRKSRLEISGLWSDYKKRANLLEKQNRQSIQLDEYRWMLEEYRISLFAQEIKTRFPISEKRLKKAWNEISDA